MSALTLTSKAKQGAALDEHRAPQTKRSGKCPDTSLSAAQIRWLSVAPGKAPIHANEKQLRVGLCAGRERAKHRRGERNGAAAKLRIVVFGEHRPARREPPFRAATHRPAGARAIGGADVNASRSENVQ